MIFFSFFFYFFLQNHRTSFPVKSVLLFFVHCCWFHKASFSSSLRQAHALKRIMHAQRTSLCPATTERSLQYFAQGYFKSGHSFQPWKLIIHASTTQNVPITLFFPPPFPPPPICLFTEWHIDQQKQIMALQELLKKKIYCAILIAVMKMNAESERLKNGSYTFAQCIFHFFCHTALTFLSLKNTMCFHSQPLELCLWLCKWENMQEI